MNLLPVDFVHDEVITKADVASTQELAEARRIATELNPNARLVALNAQDALDPALVEEWVP